MLDIPIISTSSGAITPLSKLNEVTTLLNATEESIFLLEGNLISFLSIPDVLVAYDNPRNDKASRDLRAQYEKIFQNISLDRTMILSKLSDFSGIKKVLESHKYDLTETIKANINYYIKNQVPMKHSATSSELAPTVHY